MDAEYTRRERETIREAFGHAAYVVETWEHGNRLADAVKLYRGTGGNRPSLDLCRSAVVRAFRDGLLFPTKPAENLAGLSLGYVAAFLVGADASRRESSRAVVSQFLPHAAAVDAAEVESRRRIVEKAKAAAAEV